MKRPKLNVDVQSYHMMLFLYDLYFSPCAIELRLSHGGEKFEIQLRSKNKSQVQKILSQETLTNFHNHTNTHTFQLSVVYGLYLNHQREFQFEYKLIQAVTSLMKRDQNNGMMMRNGRV
ncbi:CLUMA_CG009559, isoform A [Clunio marinus]|uniref:CLUMA_CG009559, isoform A n=1 Tax=Clunio marinus TaxID=568069 RepID=A0A1J1ICG5_9DIPT|nr:CLUMA_CG009559, isoform A [Clunio marinus]